jgi:hypothetical protein
VYAHVGEMHTSITVTCDLEGAHWSNTNQCPSF